MAQVHITYYKTLAIDGNASTMQVPMVPALGADVHTVNTSKQTDVFPDDCRFVEVTTDSDCRFYIGQDPNTQNCKTVVFAGTYRWFGIRPGQKMMIVSMSA